MPQPVSPELLRRLSKIKLFVLDVDGTLTDGGIFIGPDGDEMKRFDAHDGYGIVTLQKEYGVEVMFLSGRSCKPVDFRAKELGVKTCLQGHFYKSDALQKEIASRGLSKEEVAVMGDDLSDLALLPQAGFGFAPANAVQGVLDGMDFVTTKSGGAGAVREACNLLVQSRGGTIA